MTVPPPPAPEKIRQPTELRVRLDAETLALLASHARSRKTTVEQVARQWIEASCRHLRPDPALTPKQTQVLGLLKDGQSVKEIAAHLGVREETVRTHILRIRSHLDCPDLLSLRFRPR